MASLLSLQVTLMRPRQLPLSKQFPIDVDLSVHDRVIANAVNREVLKLSTFPPTTDLPCEDRPFHTRDLASANRFLLLIDEKFGD
jgi:hypothetical protein